MKNQVSLDQRDYGKKGDSSLVFSLGFSYLFGILDTLLTAWYKLESFREEEALN